MNKIIQGRIKINFKIVARSPFVILMGEDEMGGACEKPKIAKSSAADVHARLKDSNSSADANSETEKKKRLAAIEARLAAQNARGMKSPSASASTSSFRSALSSNSAASVASSNPRSQ